MTVRTYLSLFTGIGGLDIAAEMAGFTTVGQCEWADYPTLVLEKHWPDIPRWRDIRTLTGESFYERTGLRTVDVVSGGFPCQPFSVAGKRRGKEDNRYLWPEMLRVIQEIRPNWVVGENVAGIVNMALDTVLSDMEANGYTGQAVIIPACAVDAPHRRDRCAIIAYSNSIRRRLRGPERERVYRNPACNEADTGGKDVADAESIRLQRQWSIWEQECGTRPEKTEFEGIRDVCNSTGARLSDRTEVKVGECEKKPKFERPVWRSAQPGLGGVADGVSDWLDRGMSAPGFWLPEPDGLPRLSMKKENRANRIKCLGNAVVPQQFYPVFRAIADIDGGYDGV